MLPSEDFLARKATASRGVAAPTLFDLTESSNRQSMRQQLCLMDRERKVS